jgi:hypothetical protein
LKDGFSVVAPISCSEMRMRIVDIVDKIANLNIATFEKWEKNVLQAQ